MRFCYASWGLCARFARLVKGSVVQLLLLVSFLSTLFQSGTLAQLLPAPDEPKETGPSLPEPVKLFNGVPRTVDPELLPLSPGVAHDPACKGIKQSGSVQFSLIVDAEGRARNIVIERPVGNGIDYLALQTVELDRFKPAVSGGQPVAVNATIDLHLDVCTDNSKGAVFFPAMSYRIAPEQKLQILSGPQSDAMLAPIFTSQDDRRAHIESAGPDIVVAKPFFTPQARFSDYGFANHIQGTCKFSMIVDEHGLPRDFKVVTSMESSMLANAAKAVIGYRFRPATKHGMPVAFRTTIEVSFQSFNQ